VPESLLGPSGYLTTNQKNIESLRLITDGSCLWRQKNRLNSGPTLLGFPNLKRLSWAGLSSYEDLNTLADTLQQISQQLVEFELDLEYHVYLHSAMDRDHSLFSSKVLRPQQPITPTFHALTTLSLCSVSFSTSKFKATEETHKIFEVFDFSTLRLLKLRLCPGWEFMLEHLTGSTPPMALRSLEIQYTSYEECFDGSETIVPFLESFEGLEELFLSTSSPTQTLDIWRAMGRHSKTLRRFVHHQRTIVLEHTSILFEEERDLGDLSLYDVSDLGTDPTQNPLGELDLRSVGLSCSPKWMVCGPFPERFILAAYPI
jgi:hypothetical protein